MGGFGEAVENAGLLFHARRRGVPGPSWRWGLRWRNVIGKVVFGGALRQLSVGSMSSLRVPEGKNKATEVPEVGGRLEGGHGGQSQTSLKQAG